MEPDLTAAIRKLVQRLPEDVRQRVLQWFRETLNPTTDVTGHLSVVQDDQTLEAHGTVRPPTVRLEPGQITIMPGEVTVVRGTPPVMTWRPQHLVAVALVLNLLYCVYAYADLGPEPLPEELMAAIGAALGLLAWLYPRQ